MIAYRDAKEAGPVHLGHQVWQKLGLSEILKSELSTHQAVSGVFVTKDRRVCEIRRDTYANADQQALYAALKIDPQIFKTPNRRWLIS